MCLGGALLRVTGACFEVGMMRLMIFILTFLSAPCVLAGEPKVAGQTYLYASQPGKPTLDNGVSGGNPFAAVFVDLLKQEYSTFESFSNALLRNTERLSEGFQVPELVLGAKEDWQFLPIPKEEKRVALVLMISDYTQSGAVSLPGVKSDFARVTTALVNASFKMLAVIDPDAADLNRILSVFAGQAKKADVALVYVTGHGVETGHETYLLPGNYKVDYGVRELKYKAVNLKVIGASAQAKHANVVLFAGCRNNPFEAK